ncbi:hypothetical protein ACLIBH_13440 [Virgibacillus sp. W0430]|uniref:hypothetical protein n=1 Tax=Virgibacillus sp. W0430 TaxID=3391580 RepID=UPI003F463CED
MSIRNIFVLCFVLLLSACQKEPTLDTSEQEKSEVEFKEITANSIIEQAPSNQAKKMLQNYEEVTKINAVNTTKDLVIAFEIEHHERISLNQFESVLKEKMKKSFENYNVQLSTDKKIIIELEQLESAITNRSISSKELNKKIKDLIKLSKEHT